MTKYFFEVNFTYSDLKCDSHYLLLGYFSTLKNAKLAIEMVKDKPGFCDFGGGFEIQKFAVTFDKEISQKNELVLYELSHEYLDSEEYDNFVVFGLYATREEAEKIKEEKIKLYPYRENPEGFLIAEAKVDLLGWREGFAVW